MHASRGPSRTVVFFCDALLRAGSRSTRTRREALAAWGAVGGERARAGGGRRGTAGWRAGRGWVLSDASATCLRAVWLPAPRRRLPPDFRGLVDTAARAGAGGGGVGRPPGGEAMGSGGFQTATFVHPQPLFSRRRTMDAADMPTPNNLEDTLRQIDRLKLELAAARQVNALLDTLTTTARRRRIQCSLASQRAG